MHKKTSNVTPGASLIDMHKKNKQCQARRIADRYVKKQPSSVAATRAVNPSYQALQPYNFLSFMQVLSLPCRLRA
jgi:hypothetical protein